MVQSWMNSDNLYLKFGTDKATATIGGEYKTYGALREIEIRLPLTSVTTVATIISDAIFIPTGVRIEEVEVVTHTISTGSTLASLNIGTIQNSDRSTVIDADGLVKAMTQPSFDVAGEKTVLRVGSTFVGDDVGTSTTAVGLLTAVQASTLPFLSGVVDVRVRYYNQ